MATQKTKFTVGLFVAGGLSLATVAIIWLGMSSFFIKGQYYAAYFDESVQGLDIDSLVKYRGVSVGRVERIEVAPDSRLIQVILKIESEQPLGDDITAQLKIVGITGSMFIELDRKKPGQSDLSPHLSFPSEYPIMASKPSDISKLLGGLDDILKQIKDLDTKGISDKIKGTLDHLNQTVADADVKAISGSIQTSLAGVERILNAQRWDNILKSVEEATASFNTLVYETQTAMATGGKALTLVEGIIADEEENIKKSIEDLSLAVKEARTIFDKGASLVTRTDDSINQIMSHLMVISQNLEKGSENLNRLIEIVSDQPSLLIFDEPSHPRRIENKRPR